LSNIPAGTAAGDPFVGAAFDAAELLDVDVDQLARPLAFVADRWFQAQASEFAHPIPFEDRADRRARDAEQVGQLGRGEPQPAQGPQQLLGARVGAIVDVSRRAGPIQQPNIALRPEASDPLRTRPAAHSGR
jgi:hypothetical protein